MPASTDNPALRAHLASQADTMNELALKSLDTLRQISDINLKLARQTIESAIYASREMINTGDPAQCAQAWMKQLQPAAERLRSYQQHLLSVLAGAQADFTQTAQSRMPEASRRANAAADEMARRASSAADEMARRASGAVTVPVTGPGGRTPNGPATPASGNGGSGNGKPHAP